MIYDRSKAWFEVGVGAASEMKGHLNVKLKRREYAPLQIQYIEARGALCDGLIEQLGGSMEYIETPKRQFIYRLLERWFSIAPINRWYPPEGSILEWVGCEQSEDTRAYRVTAPQHQAAIFLIKFKPEAKGYYGRSPQLYKLLQPPFNDDAHVEGNAANKGMWVEFSGGSPERI